MKPLFFVIAMSAALVAGAAALQAPTSHAGHVIKPAPPKTGQAKAGKVRRITVVVRDGRYVPSVIRVARGVPVEIAFRGGENMGCGASISFPTLRQTKTVEPGGVVRFAFVPARSGEIPFACSMDMIRGRVVVK